jgi:plasmid stabilization system protein ParE
MNIDFLDLAEADLDDVFKYYEYIQNGLDGRFIVELKSTLSRIQHNLELGRNSDCERIDAFSIASPIQ